MKITNYILFFLTLSSGLIQGQTDTLGVGDYKLKVEFSGTFPQSILEKIPSTFEDWAGFENWQRKQFLVFQKAGYFEASVDTQFLSQDTIYVVWDVGQFWNGIQIISDSASKSILSLYEIDVEGSYSPVELRQTLDLITVRLANEGYPFTQSTISDIHIMGDSIIGRLEVRPGSQVFNAGIKVNGKVALSPEFLERFLDWVPGQPYNHELLLSITEKMKGLRFVELIGNPRAKFYYDRVALELDLKKRRSNKFDFLLGVLPGNDLQNRGVILSVLLNMELNNALGLGERMLFNFNNTKPRTQELELGFNYPYIMNLPFGVDAAFELYRNDESNLDLRYLLGASYLPGKGLTFSVFYDRFSSTLLNPDTAFLLNSGFLPQNLDHSINKFGLTFTIQKLDNILAPRRGWRGSFKASAGIKKISTNDDLLELETEALPVESFYDSLQMDEDQFEFGFDLDHYWPLTKRIVLKSSMLLRTIQGASSILENELFRTGGSRQLRGFDEEFFRVSSLAIATAELRFYIAENSFLSGFVDYGILKKNTTTEDLNISALGFGLGFNFQTEVGIFSLQYALGQTQDIPLDFNSGKVHFGYISLF